MQPLKTMLLNHLIMAKEKEYIQFKWNNLSGKI